MTASPERGPVSGGGPAGKAAAPSGPGHGAPSSRVWPFLIVVGFVIVILVNAFFIYVAVSGADDVVPSYVTEER